MDFKYFLENSTDFFKETHEYFELRRKFKSIMPWVDMIVGPLITIISFIYYGSYDMLSALSFAKAGMVFREWLRYIQLSRKISEWKGIVNQNGGPIISTNDPEYHVFVYADGMQRLHNSYFRMNCLASHHNH
jgi:hypothetical protein